VASWNSEGGGGGDWDGNSEDMVDRRGNAVWNSKCIGVRGFSSAIPEGEDGKSFT